ncbi:MAG: hypothetical protein IPL86_07465 [Flavobacteriales bacterium]|nr:hypothetical protein [Flavobacteriales bacterium]
MPELPHHHEKPAHGIPLPGKSAASAVFAPSAEEVQTGIKQFVDNGEAALYVAEVPVHDDKGNHLATGKITASKAVEQRAHGTLIKSSFVGRRALSFRV